ncbi:MAG: hypothetical protein MJ090_00900 [Clostridia bacterium]|nr:hypothetical protein [Clostridia bacterium]
MRRFEKTAVDFLIKQKNTLYFIAITVLSLVARLFLFQYESGDMQVFLIPWYRQFLQNGGLKALGSNIGDYNLLYQTIIAFISVFKVSEHTFMIIIKSVSMVFDYVLAVSASFIIKKITNKGTVIFNLAYTAFLLLPTHILNSSFWGQSDAVYVSFLLLTVWYLYENKNITAFVFYGLAFAFKFQSIFVLPFILTYYFYKKSFSLFNFFISAGVVWISGIVAFIFGQDLLAPAKIYFAQTSSYKRMWLNYPSFWVLIGDNYDKLCVVAVAVTLSVLGFGFYLVISKYKKIETSAQYLSLCAWFVWTSLLLLPSMHERYGFLLDVLLLILSFISIHYVKYFLVSNIIGMLTYGYFLFGTNYVINVPTVLIFVSAYLLFTYNIFSESTLKFEKKV